ncbi:MAG: prepilin peptidase [Ruminococcaceae bacterium]|nr:prepilin peptidase [Oscillospiraceae bacterium]
MYSVIITLLFGLLSAFMSFFMFYYTNKKIELIDTSIENNEENDIPCLKKYEKNVYSLISLIVIIVLSALSGFIISKNAVSITALIMLGVSYIVLLGAAVIDYKLKIIPNFFPLVLIISRILILIYEFIFTNTVVASFLSSLIGFFLSGLLLIIANKLSKGGIGAGDIKLLASLGLMCGVYVAFSTLLLALIACILISLILIALKKKTSKDVMPFGPFIYIGYLVMCLFTLY